MSIEQPHIALFRSAREVIKADAACRAHGVRASIWPVPEQFSSECGMCLHVEPNETTAFQTVMQTLSIHPTLIPYEK